MDERNFNGLKFFANVRLNPEAKYAFLPNFRTA